MPSPKRADLDDYYAQLPEIAVPHLTKLRDRRIVDYRRDSQTFWYRISDPRIEKLFVTLHGLFCGQQKSKSAARVAIKRRKGKS